MSLRTVLTSVKHAIFGKPVTHEEYQAAQRNNVRGDLKAQAQFETRNGFQSPGPY